MLVEIFSLRAKIVQVECNKDKYLADYPSISMTD